MSKDDYIINKNEHIGGNCIVLNCSYHSDLLNVVNRENITSILLSEWNGWKDSNIEFLSRIPNLKGVQIYSRHVSSLDALKALKNLELIGIDTNSKRHPNFKQFSRLKTLLISWKKGTESCFGHPTLEYINTDKYPYENLNNFQNNKSLKRLKLSSPKLRNLSDIHQLPNLSNLDFFYCPRLNDINHLADCEALEELEFYSCKKIGKFPSMNEAKRLRKVKIENCGNIESLNSFRDCENLEKFLVIGDTKIEDGNLDHILKIPTLRFFRAANKRHYSHSRSEIKAILDLRKNN